MNSLRTLSLVSLAFAAAPFAAYAQGSLTPAGAPAPMMKTLAQIEARIDVNTLPGDASSVRVITQPGSYYLTADVNGVAGKSGIRIMANDVALDLNGFTVRGTGAGSGNGIWTSNVEGDPEYTGLQVRNGRISYWGGSGIEGAAIRGLEASHLRVEQCGAAGIYVAGGLTLIDHCTVTFAGWAGIYVGNYGTDSLIRDCVVTSVSSGAPTWGIYSGYGNVEGCRVRVVKGSTAKGIETGLMTGRVTNCDVSQVSATIAANLSIGISAAAIDGCSISMIGSATTSGHGVYGSYPMSVLHTRISDIEGINAYGIYTYYAKDAHNNNGTCLVQSCVVTNVTSHSGSSGGIHARTILDCQVSSVQGDTINGTANGIVPANGGLVSRCTVTNVEGNGIDVSVAALVTDNSITSAGCDTTGAGIHIAHAAARVERNRVSGSPVGYNQVAGTALVIANFAQGNSTNYNGVFAGAIVSTSATFFAGSSALNVSF